MTSPRTAPLPAALDRVEHTEALDRFVAPVEQIVRQVPERTRRMLHGAWLGHPLHPAIVHVPIGAWVGASVMDLVRQKGAARWLTAFGLVTAVPTAAAGWVDWADLRPQHKRTGLVHAAANALGILLYAGSLAARCTGQARCGRKLGLAGLAAVSVGGAIGGDLVFRRAAGVNHVESAPYLVEPGWHPLGPAESYPVGRSVRASLGEVPVFVRREHDGAVHVLAAECGHLSGPLADGEVKDGCVICPWHGSTFRLDDGEAVRGPAITPQPVFETRVVEGRLEARLPDAG